MNTIQIYDTTLRDGTQSEELSLSTEDMIQELVYLQKGAVAVQIFSFYGRLVLTALAFMC